MMVKARFGSIDCASSGVDDHVRIFVADEIDGGALIRHVAEKTRLNKAAFQVIQVEEIPKNDAGKVLYQELANESLTQRAILAEGGEKSAKA